MVLFNYLNNFKFIGGIMVIPHSYYFKSLPKFLRSLLLQSEILVKDLIYLGKYPVEIIVN